MGSEKLEIVRAYPADGTPDSEPLFMGWAGVDGADAIIKLSTDAQFNNFKHPLRQ
jgi:hypothetical protein